MSELKRDRVPGLDRILGRCGTANVASLRVLEKVGMRFEKAESDECAGGLQYYLTPELFQATGGAPDDVLAGRS